MTYLYLNEPFPTKMVYEAQLFNKTVLIFHDLKDGPARLVIFHWPRAGSRVRARVLFSRRKYERYY